ncbi:MAG: GHMP family kinase ATP-binding protein [Promethearchaeota archaeon]
MVLYLLKSIKNFIINLNPDIIIQAPSRINLINPLDAVEGDFWMPSVAINGKKNPLCTFLYIKQIEKLSRIKTYKITTKLGVLNFEIESEEILTQESKEIKKKFNSEFKLIYGSIYRFFKINSYFRKKILSQKIEIGIITTIPQQSGLGGSASIIIAILYGLANYFNLYNNMNCVRNDEFPINKDIIAEMATKVEDEDLGITAGYADRYVICRGGLSFCSYYGKLMHKEISMEPLAVYDRVDEIYDLKEIPIIVCFSGVFHKSGGIHQRLRKLYLQKNQRIISGYEELAEISWKSRFALMSRNWKLLGSYFKENTKIMNKIMIDAGFKYGIGLANNILIDLINKHPDVYAVKLTGAGGGGSVFALVNPEKIQLVLKDWKKKLNEIITNKRIFQLKFPKYPLNILNQLKNAEFYQINIDKDGVKKIIIN